MTLQLIGLRMDGLDPCNEHMIHVYELTPIGADVPTPRKLPPSKLDAFTSEDNVKRYSDIPSYSLHGARNFYRSYLLPLHTVQLDCPNCPSG